MKPRQRGGACPPARGGAQWRGSGKDKGVAASADKLLQFFTQLAIVALWKSLAALSAPVSRVFAFYFWTGRATVKLSQWVQRLLLKVVGWLGSPAVSRDHWLRAWGRHYSPIDVKKWHLAVGALLGRRLARGACCALDARARKKTKTLASPPSPDRSTRAHNNSRRRDRLADLLAAAQVARAL